MLESKFVRWHQLLELVFCSLVALAMSIWILVMDLGKISRLDEIQYSFHFMKIFKFEPMSVSGDEYYVKSKMSIVAIQHSFSFLCLCSHCWTERPYLSVSWNRDCMHSFWYTRWQYLNIYRLHMIGKKTFSHLWSTMSLVILAGYGMIMVSVLFAGRIQ